MSEKMKLIIGISGASGAIYGVRLLEILKELKVETHLIITAWGKNILEHETNMTFEKVRSLADYMYDDTDLSAGPSSGSFKVDAMVVIPCSMKTVACISSGITSSLLTRVADVTLKEGRHLIIVPRETPLSAVHLKNLYDLSRFGVTILPAMPGFYNKPKSLINMVDHIIGKVLDQLNLKHNLYEPWKSSEK
jgi:4-hydroxy-3-polyprenylbenzoate decarboxylase|tara:strand:+ start:171 stop:746 length:576 start_codon:yes stop_codon:yes gene_type:complete